jgi:exodeoxyribonuclease VII small subunit
MTAKHTYAQALGEIEGIISEIENETIEVDVLSDKVKRAVELIKYCKATLRKTEDEIGSMLKEFDEKPEVKTRNESAPAEKKSRGKTGPEEKTGSEEKHNPKEKNSPEEKHNREEKPNREEKNSPEENGGENGPGGLF